MKIFLAGAGNVAYPTLCVKHNMPKLYSALNEINLIQKYPADSLLMVDSGAHSWNKISMNVVGGKARTGLPNLSWWARQYADYIMKWTRPNRIFVELDCYGEAPYDKIQSWTRGFRHAAGSAKVLRVYHTGLDCGDLSVLKDWLSEGDDYIGLGLDCMHLWPKIFSLTRDKIKYHGFAATRKDIIEKYPFYSVDSSTAIAGTRYGGNFIGYSYVSKDKLRATKNPLLMNTCYKKQMEAGIVAMKKLQDFGTSLWASRGVTWKD